MEPLDRRKDTISKNMVNTIDFQLKFSKLCLTFERKVLTLSDVLLNVGRGNI